MKIAICLSGQVRFVNESCNYLFNALNSAQVDYFLHLWSDDESEKNNVLTQYNPVSYKFNKQKIFDTDLEMNKNHGRNIKTPHDSSITLSSIYGRYAVGQVLKEYIDIHGDIYDFYLWTRTDFCPLDNIVSQLTTSDIVHTAYVEGEEWNKNYLDLSGMICSNLENMMHFFDLYNNYKRLFLSGIDHCDHRLSMAYMKEKTNKYKQILGYGCMPGDISCRRWGLMRSHGFSKS